MATSKPIVENYGNDVHPAVAHAGRLSRLRDWSAGEHPPTYPNEATAPFSKGGAAEAAGNWEPRSGARSFAPQNFGAFFRSEARKKARSRPISRVLSWTVIPLGAASPRRSSNLPGDTAGRGMVSLFGFAPGGVCRTGPLPDSWCALTAPFHPYHARLATPFGGLLSVALSVGFRRPGVTWHRALWSPDFPRHPFG